jgi:hypothetical protein
LIRETQERLTQIENKVPDQKAMQHQKAMQPPSERCRNDDLPHHSPRPPDPNRRRLL